MNQMIDIIQTLAIYFLAGCFGIALICIALIAIAYTTKVAKRITDKL